MRITAFLLLFSVIQVMGENSYSQNTRLSLNLKDVSIENVLDEIEDQSEFYFLFNQKLVNVDRKVDIDVKNKSIKDILADLFASEDVNSLVMDRQILLSPKYIIERVNVTRDRQPQEIVVTGIVTDVDGNLLPGVTILIKGTTQGTITDIDGNYSIEVQDPDAVLVFSYIGMRTFEVQVNDQTSIDVVLEMDVVGLDEVIAIGYGVKRKVNLTGSVASVSSTELVRRPVANVENLLQGKVPGLQVVQNSGRPGKDEAVMRIRGLGTFSSAGNNPLILVDGIQGDLTDLEPDNIESVSVLKDAASSAIYGARAANGVILVTTKKGQTGALNVEYHVNYQLQQPTRQPELVTNSADFMEMWNYANERGNYPNYFTQAEIDAFRNATDRVKYPNFDWIERCMHNANALNHHLSMNGGVGGTTYNFSLGHLHQDGIIDMYEFKKYNLRLIIDSKVSDRVSFGANIALNYKDIIEPMYNDIAIIYSPGPNYTPYLSDGSGRLSARYNVEAWHNRNPVSILEGDGVGSHMIKRYGVTSQAYMDINITKDLTWKIKGAINYDNDRDKFHEFTRDNYYFVDNSYAHNGWPVNLGVRENNQNNILTTFYSTLNYTKTFGDHNINALLGYNQENNNYNYLNGYRQTFPTGDLRELNAGSSDGQKTAGSANEWAIQSILGRINYDFMGKYLVEANFRYDGTSRLYKDNRWGLFPSLSAGWRLSEEQLLNDLLWLDNLKIRASWGILGNQNIGIYPYQEILSIISYPFTIVEQGVVQTRLTDRNLKWETTTITDIGVDFSVKNGLFSLSADWFDKVTDDILYQIEIPANVGLSSPTINYAKMRNTGFEFEVGHSNQVNELRYGVNFNFSTYKNEVLKVKSPTYNYWGGYTIQEGLPWKSHYFIEWIGIFQSQAEIDEGPTHPYNPKPGDLKFKDKNGDGVINSEDRIVVDGAHPDFYYGGNINLSWKNFDLTAFFQGVQGIKFKVNLWGIDPFMQGSPPTKEFAENCWTPENPTNKYPAMHRYGYNPVTGTYSTYLLQDASYFKLKNLVIGFNVPKDLCQKIRMKALHVYLSGDNLITITDYPGADPERTGNGIFATYPQLRIFTAGIKVKF